MSFNNTIEKVIDNYKDEKSLHERIVSYFENNKAARLYAEVCEEKNWEFIVDHLTIRTYVVEDAAKEFEAMGWKFDTRLDYKDQGWWANVYRHEKYPMMFVDQNYEDAPEDKKILKKWVDVFGDKDYHHIAVRLPQGVEIEEVISLLEQKGVVFPGKVTGAKGTRLRQIFSQAENKNGTPFSILELTQRGVDKNGNVYEGLINEQADSLMKDSVL